MDVNKYLERINYRGSLAPTYESLKDLQLAHLLYVPFENLSIHVGEPIILRNESLFEKIVLNRRGGFCYELNGLFAALLRRLGFNVFMLGAGVARGEGGFGPDCDHMALMVLLEDRWLVDVGFGDSFRQPLLIDKREVQLHREGSYQIDDEGDYLMLNARNNDNVWKIQYRFTLKPHKLTDYLAMCHYHQTSPESHFTQRRICTRALPGGRLTLSDMRLIETAGSEKRERVLKDELEYADILKREFGIIVKNVGGQASSYDKTKHKID